MWLGAFFCFIAVPFLLINTALYAMLKARSQNEKQEIFTEMDNKLNFAFRYSRDAHYFHDIFQRQFKRASRHESPVEAFAVSIKNLRDRYPKGLKFIVWDTEGKIVDHLTDETSYRYILNNLQPFFNLIAEHCRENYPGAPETLPLVQQRINLFRAYLGKFLLVNHLKYPFQTGDQGQCILADTRDNTPMFWFDSNDKLTAYVAVSSELLDRNLGTHHAIDHLNKDNPKIHTGFINVTDLSGIEKFDEATQRQIIVEVGKFENASLPHLETENFLISFKLLSPDTRGFCLIRKTDMHMGYPEHTRKQTLIRLLMAILLTTFIIYCYNLSCSRLTISIRARLAFLFLYATGLPLMILGTIGFEYVQQRRISLFQDTHRHNERLILELDGEYRLRLKELQQHIATKIGSFSAQFETREVNRDDFDGLRNLLYELDAEEIMVFGKDGDTKYNYRRDGQRLSNALLQHFAKHMVNFVNMSVKDDNFLTKELNVKIAGGAVPDYSPDMMIDMLTKFEKLEELSFGTQNLFGFVTLLGNTDKAQAHSLLLMTWKQEKLQAAYADKRVESFNEAAQSFSAAMAVHSNQIFCSRLEDHDQLRPTLQKAFNLQSAHENTVAVDNTNYVVTAVAARNMNNIVMAILTPLSILEEQITQLEQQLKLFSLLSIILALSVVFALSRQFLSPVRELSNAVVEIGRRNFQHKTNITTNDEFGDLGRVFNTTIEGMAELEIGRVVQENLFPGNKLKHCSIGIYAKTVTMTRLGGDYYDFFAIDDNHLGVFMGDVAGHGIPAALIMAMAKAGVVVSRNENADSAGMLTRLHNMMYKLKNKKFKRMMTCQFLTVNGVNGTISFANAGHCFPIIVDNLGSSARYEEMIGSPVGIMKKARYKNQDFALKPGDTIMLYSDGMIESANAQGEPFGESRLLELAKTAWDRDLELYYNNLYSANNAWSPVSDDDLTIVLLRYQPEETS